ncbi:MAG: hypothetical protein RMJ97_12110, partial [Raineya sp.]|nr:hypothetical protein [Raineya sp.]
FLLLADNTSENNFKIEILKSPLGLAKNISINLFENRFYELQEKLDIIKSFAAGVSSSKKFMEYGLARYYPHLFAFHQFFHSSFRARQGKVLEKIIFFVLKNYVKCSNVVEGNKNQEILKPIFESEIENLDLDALGVSEDTKKMILIQIRSRDDTGGTTAKSSLVELLRSILRTRKIPDVKILYLVCVWDEREKNQKNSTIAKFYSSLKEYIPNENSFKDQIEKSYFFNDKLAIRLAYGINAISKAIFEWSESQDESILKAIEDIVGTVERWDDLWISASIANLELEMLHTRGISNVNILQEKLESLNFEIDKSSYKTICQSVAELTNLLVPTWHEKSLPFDNIADKAHYIRDLIFLHTIYQYTPDHVQKFIS